MDYQGDELAPLDEDAVRAAAKSLREQGVESVAVCYLFSFQNPDHEQRTAKILREELADWRVSLSSVVLPTIREYPRQSTTVIDAYVGPIMQRYLERLSDRLADHGVVTPSGGLMRITQVFPGGGSRSGGWPWRSRTPICSTSLDKQACANRGCLLEIVNTNIGGSWKYMLAAFGGAGPLQRIQQLARHRSAG